MKKTLIYISLFILLILENSYSAQIKERNFIKDIKKIDKNFYYQISFKESKINFINNFKDYDNLINKKNYSSKQERQKIILDNFFLKSKDNYISTFLNGKPHGAYRKFHYNNLKNNPIEFLALITSEIIHGYHDDNLTYNNKLETLLKRKLILTCSSSSLFIKDLLNFYNIESRIVSTNATSLRNGYDDGHILLEIFINDFNKWILFDVTNGVVFKDLYNKYLSIYELKKIDFDLVNIIKLTDSPKLDFSSYMEYQFLQDYTYYNLRDWFERIFENVSIIGEGWKKYILNYNIKKRNIEFLKKENPDLIFLNEKKFHNRFYK